MKKQAFTKKLSLATETVHVLSNADLAEANGGALALFYGHSRNGAVTCRLSIAVNATTCRHSAAGSPITCRTTLP
jgi:hypothetical protein